MPLDPRNALGSLPTGLVDDLLSAFREVVKNYSENRWEPSELNGGKLCETAYTIVEGYLAGGTYEARARKPRNMVASCAKLENLNPNAPRSARIQIPRMIVALYEIRNNRGVGHAGGDVNPNHMDATAVLYMAKWVVAELIRLLHGLSTTEAAAVVDGLVERQVSLVWSLDGVKRVLVGKLTYRQQTLLLLVGDGAATEADLLRWLEHKRPADYRKDVLRPMHRSRLIEYDEVAKTVSLLPPGVAEAEDLIQQHVGQRDG